MFALRSGEVGADDRDESSSIKAVLDRDGFNGDEICISARVAPPFAACDTGTLLPRRS